MKHKVYGFEQFLIKNCMKRKKAVIETVRIIAKSSVSDDANVISSNALYRVKTNNYGSFKLKGRILPHGNEDNLGEELLKDCTVCLPSGFRIGESISSPRTWKVYKTDVKSAFLPTGATERERCVRKTTKREWDKNTYLWLLLTAAYGFVSAHAKWKNKYDQVIFDMALKRCKPITQRFYNKEDGNPKFVVAKLVDGLKAARSNDNGLTFIERFNKTFELGTM